MRRSRGISMKMITKAQALEGCQQDLICSLGENLQADSTENDNANVDCEDIGDSKCEAKNYTEYAAPVSSVSILQHTMRTAIRQRHSYAQFFQIPSDFLMYRSHLLARKQLWSLVSTTSYALQKGLCKAYHWPQIPRSQRQQVLLSNLIKKDKIIEETH